MAVQEELYGRTGVEPDEEAREDKAVDLADGEICRHPVDLGVLSGKKVEFAVDFPVSLPELLCICGDRGVLAPVS